MSEQVSLGHEVIREGKLWRVIRLAKQQVLFEDQSGVLSVLDEHLAEIKGEKGEIDFIVFSSERQRYDGPPSKIKAPEPVQWKETKDE